MYGSQNKTKRGGTWGGGGGNKTQIVNFSKHIAAGGEVFSMNLKKQNKTKLHCQLNSANHELRGSNQ